MILGVDWILLKFGGIKVLWTELGVRGRTEE